MDSLIKIYPQAPEALEAASDDFIARAKAAIAKKNAFTVVLSGGETAKLLFDKLYLQRDLDWSKIKICFGDERYLPSNAQGSNYQAAYEHLFAKIPLPSENIFRIPTELSPADAATHYAKMIAPLLPFDLTYLGLGDDAHTASLMPESEALDNQSDLVVSLWVAALNMYRITLTPLALNQSEAIHFLVFGEGKAKALRDTLQGEWDPKKYPAQYIQSKEKIVWYLDEKAASLLQQEVN